MDNEQKRHDQDQKDQRQGQQLDKDQLAKSPRQRQSDRSTADDRTGRMPHSTEADEQITDVDESDLGEQREASGLDNEEADIPSQPKRTPR